MILYVVETLANSPIWLGLCGFGVIVVPIMGISYIHNNNKK